MLGYRTFFHVHVPDEDVIPLATGQLYAWLRKKRYDADELRSGETVRLAPEVEALVLESSPQDGTHSLRARITENNRSGRWVTQLTVHVPRRHEAPWVWLDIEAPDSAPWTSTPGLARNLLEVFPAAYDGEAELRPEPSLATVDDAEVLLDVVCDPDRRGLVMLGGSNDDLPVARWHQMVGKLVKETAGLAATYVLDGPATARFGQLIGPDHAVAPGTVRTFLPAVDPADPQDALRHRVLGTQRIVRGHEQSLTRLLGWKARERAIEAPLPKSAVRLAKLFDKQSDDLLLARLTTVPARVVDESPSAVHLLNRAGVLDLAHEVSGSAELTPDVVADLIRLVRLGRRADAGVAAVGDRLRELQGRADDLESDNHELVRRFEDEQLEHAAAIERWIRSDRTVTYLRRQLVATGGGAEAWSEPVVASDEKQWPDDFGELIERFDELKFVQFTGDVSKVCQLDQHDPMGTWAKKAWDALRALDDYGRLSGEGNCPRDVHGYLESPPDGCHVYPQNKHARDESDDVHNNDRFRSARIFPVPAVVDPAGEVFMGAHFRIAKSGMISPRMHYFDATATTGLSYVGYLGRHLPTKRTN